MNRFGFNSPHLILIAEQHKRIFQPGLASPLKKDSAELLWACADYVIDHYDELPEHIPLHCGIIRINPDFFIFSMGGEPVIDLQTVLRDAFPGKTVLCFGFNDAIAYIPSDRILAEGGYEAGKHNCEIEYRLKGRCRPGVDAIITQGFKNAMRGTE